MLSFKTLIFISLAICLAACSSQQPSSTTSIKLFRDATKADLEFNILKETEGPDGFPVLHLFLQSETQDEILVTYVPNCITIHCGPYFQGGPGATSNPRREILGPFGYLEFAPSTQGWQLMSNSGKAELMVPTTLPSGNYDVWATLIVPGPQGGVLSSHHLVLKN